MTVLMLVLLITAGTVAGALTTLAGLGGGVLLIALLSQVWAPATVLGVTAPALFIGNGSRMVMLHRSVAWPLVARFALAGLPCAFVASLMATHLPATWLQLGIAVLLLGFLVSEGWGGRKIEPEIASNPWLASLAGAIAGTVSGLTGGAGFVAAPLLHRLGLSPIQLVATSAACMALVHLAKGVGFTVGSVLTPERLPMALAIAFGIVLGNAAGARVLSRMPREVFRRCLMAALALAAAQLLWSAR